jgi:N-acetylmuramoyl-L-alanine amidase
MVTIRKHLVSNSIISKVTSGKGNLRKKVCIHETDNTRAGANANAHARLQANGNSRQASWHYTVDDKEAVQSFTHDIKCWHAGTTQGNNEAIAIEICVNSDGDYRKAVQNAAALTAKILKEEGLTINDVVQHNYYSGKNCPRIMRSGSVIPWSSFIQMVKSNLQPTPQKKEELTLAQYEELKKLIEAQNKIIEVQIKKIDELEQKLGLKEREVSESHKEAWKWAKENGLLNGQHPQRPVTREQLASVLYRQANQ